MPAAPVRVVAPRPGPAVGVRAPRSRGDRDEGARGARRGGDRGLVRRAPPRPQGRRGDRRDRRGRGAGRGARRRPPLRAGRRLGLREPLRVAVTRRARLSYLASLLLPLALLPLAAPARAARRTSRARTEPALEHGHPDLRQDALRGDGDPRAPRRDRLRRRAARRALAYVAALAALAGAVVLGPLGRVHDSSRRARRRRAPWARARARRRARQRDEHARRAPVRPPADLQLPRAARGRLGGRRRAAADVPGQPAPGAGAARSSPPCGADPQWRRVFAEDGILVFRRR